MTDPMQWLLKKMHPCPNRYCRDGWIHYMSFKPDKCRYCDGKGWVKP